MLDMREKKRVVHITTVHHPYDPRIYYKECLSLKKAGYEVIYIAQGDTEGEKVKGLRHIRLKKYSNRLLRMIFGTLDAYKKAKELNAHIYHFHDPELIVVGWLLKRKDNIVIYDVHEDYLTSILQKEYLPRLLRTFLAKVYQLIERFFIRQMELCLAEKYYKEIYNRGRWILNYPTIDLKFLNEHKLHRANRKGLLYTGNVTKDRGALIHAQIPLWDSEVTVHFVGKCAKKLSEEMQSLAKQEKDRLLFEGIDQFVKKERIEEVYLKGKWLAGLALFPKTDHYRKKELTKFFEYMLAGIPIICSNFPVWKKFVEQYQCGIAVDPYEPKQIKDAIHYLRTHPEQAQKMGEKGRQAVLQKLNWKEEERKLIQWYDHLLQQRERKEKDRVEP